MTSSCQFKIKEKPLSAKLQQTSEARRQKPRLAYSLILQKLHMLKWNSEFLTNITALIKAIINFISNFRRRLLQYSLVGIQ